MNLRSTKQYIAIAVVFNVIFIGHPTAYADTGFSASTELMMKNILLERMYNDPAIFKVAARALIQRQLAFEAKELDPEVLQLLVDRLDNAVRGLPVQPVPRNLKSRIPLIIMLPSIADVKTNEKIKAALAKADKREILRLYFKMEQDGGYWHFWQSPSTSLDWSEVTLTVPVNSAIARNEEYKAEFIIKHPVDTWVMDPTVDFAAKIVIEDPDAVSLKYFGTLVEPLRCESYFSQFY